MKKRLKDVIGSLYKPSTGSRQAFALPRADAEQLPRLPSVAVISITAPERPPAAVGGFEYLLRLSFADVDFLNPGCRPERKRKSMPLSPRPIPSRFGASLNGSHHRSHRSWCIAREAFPDPARWCSGCISCMATRLICRSWSKPIPRLCRY